ncbi:unnamed protein product [Microthlaspi erraticum]|uniref:Uncharacterized protein n=1 Tax=Microthlaspi erraticum TaxID=1685480 RepID=A0A6D2KTK4_9BRAS|nr:unnamed protein product [Microthlaspi erraticum]
MSVANMDDFDVPNRPIHSHSWSSGRGSSNESQRRPISETSPFCSSILATMLKSRILSSHPSIRELIDEILDAERLIHWQHLKSLKKRFLLSHNSNHIAKRT